MIKDLLVRTLSQAVVLEEERPGIEKFSRRALGILAGAAAFVGFTKVVAAQGQCSSECGQVCPGSNQPCTNSCSGGQCWENFETWCCDYRCGPNSGPVCCSVETWSGFPPMHPH